MKTALRPVPEIAPRAILYLRQSVARDDSISLELQELAGRDHCTRQGYEVIDVLVDEGKTGRNWSKRPDVQRAITMIETKQADIIVLWKWSRLSRNRKDWALAADRVDIAGGRIESATEPIDTATASGRFARGVMTEYAAFQSEQIGEQWAEVHHRRFMLGLPPGVPTPFGYEKDGNRGIRQHPTNADIVRKLYDMYFNGDGFTKMARWLNDSNIPARRGGKWSPVSLRGTLDSPIQAGLVEYQGETREGQHEAIISRERWELYKQMRADRTVPKKPRTSTHLLSSLVVCECGKKRYGKTFRYSTGQPTGFSYFCTYPVQHAKRSVVTWKVDNPVGEWVKSLALHADAPPTLDEYDADATAREITALERRLAKLTEHLLDDIIPKSTYRKTHDQITKEIERLQALQAQQRAQSHRTAAAFLTGKEEIIAGWDVLALEDKQAFLRSTIRAVRLHPDNTATIATLWGSEVVIEVS